LIEDIFYGYIEPFTFSLFLIFIFLSVQILFLWKDVDKNGLRKTFFLNDSFFKRNCIYIYSFSLFFIVHGFIESVIMPANYLMILKMLTLISLVLFTYDWYSILEMCSNKRSLPKEFTNWRILFKRDKR
jgi:hypothetical protein